jgi:IS30 family transposase
MSYTHLTQEERYQISALLRAKLSPAAIARELSRSPSTIYREIARNRMRNGYWPKQAVKQARRRLRQRACRNVRRVDEFTWEMAQAYLKMQWSPEQIADILRQTQGAPCISHETIYRKIYARLLFGDTLAQHLRQARPKRRRRKRANRNESRYGAALRARINQRPAIVDERSRIGDWEGDTVIGANQKQALVVWVERRSGFVLMAKVERKTSAAVCQKSIGLLRPFKHCVHTLTTDNGTEFAQHAQLSKALRASSYFADPYSSWQRGTVENTNGLIRQYFPKKKRFEDISEYEIQFVMNRLNHRPRKRLNFKTPHEVFMSEAFALRV